MLPASADSPCSVADASPRTWFRDLLWLGLLAFIFFTIFSGVRPLASPDEGRYTEIPREMAASGDFVTPRLNGVRYFEKPPLLYWLSALTFQVAGVNEYTARLWNSLFAVGGVLLTYAAARRLYGRTAGIASAVVLGTSLLYHVLAQVILLDMAVAVTMSGALFSFLLGMREPAGRRRALLFHACYVCMALAVLSKGLIGILLPGAVMFLWILLLNRWRTLRPFYPWTGSLLLLAIAAPWHVLAARANADFLNFYFVHEHWLRFTTRIHDRYEPWWWLLPWVVLGLFPWVLFSLPALRQSLAGGWKARKEEANETGWFLAIWIVFIVAFFSKSQSKLIPYVLPVFPAAAVVLGRYLAAVWQGESAGQRPRPLRIGGWIYAGIAIALGIAALFARAPKAQPALAELLPYVKGAACLVLLGTAAAVIHGLRRDRPRWILGSLTAGTLALMLVAGVLGSVFEKGSSREFARILARELRPEDRIYAVDHYPQDIPVYLGRLIHVVEYEGELEFGIRSEPAVSGPRFLDRPTFLAQWRQPGTAYALLDRRDYDRWFGAAEPHEVLARNSRRVLVRNGPVRSPADSAAAPATTPPSTSP